MSTMIKDLPREECPRERLITYGAEALSNEELLAIIFRTGIKGVSVKNLSLEVLKKCKNINNLKELSLNSLKNIKGLGTTKAVSLLASLELGKRVYKNEEYESKPKIRNATEAFMRYGSLINSKKQEHLLAIYLDAQRQAIAHKILFIGTVDHSTVHLREIFKEAFLESATGIIIMHNHPSGVVVPSEADDILTREVYNAAAVFGITIHDHLIVSEYDFYSYMEEGRIAYAE